MEKKELLISQKSTENINKKISNIIKGFDKETYYNEYINNVISFVGERGSGKTSMMLSMANLKKEEAVILDLIEPELFENNTRLIEVVISKMYALYRNEYRKNKELHYTDKDINELNKNIIEILKSIKIYFERREDYYEKEISVNLLEISDCFKIKLKFKELVENYLKVMNRIKNKNYKYILLMIDDIDLNYKNGYSILEQVRKFLIVPNLINFIAYKESQLAIILENEFSEIEKMDTTQKYLKKLFPYENKIYTNGKEELIAEEKDYTSVSSNLLKVFKNVFLEEKIEIFYPETYRELRAFNSFFETESHNVSIAKYINFLGGNIVNEINKLKIKKNYLKELFEMEKKLEEDLSIDEQRVNLIKREYILQNQRKIKTYDNIIEYIKPLKINIWGKNNIFYKENFFEGDHKLYNILYYEIEKGRIKNKKLILKFIDDLLLNKNKIDPLNLFLENNIDLSSKEVYELLIKIKKIQNLEDLFEVILSNKTMKEKLEKTIESIKNSNIVKRNLELALFLNINFYKKTKCDSLDEIIALIHILKNIPYCEINIINQIFDVKTVKDAIEQMKQLKKGLTYIKLKVPALQEISSIYLRKISEATQYIKSLEIVYKKNIRKNLENEDEIKFNYEYGIQNKLLNTFDRLVIEIERALDAIDLPCDDWHWIDNNYSLNMINKILEDVMIDNRG